MLFYDTNALLKKLQQVFKEETPFMISIVTLKELEQIKTSGTKDEDVKYRARRVLNLLAENEGKYRVCYEEGYNKFLEHFGSSNDVKIIKSALAANILHNITFVTGDLSCKNMAEIAGLNVELLQDKDSSTYCGYKERCFTEEELADFYHHYDNPIDTYDMKINEYLIVKDELGDVIDHYKLTDKGFMQVPYNVFESKMFGKIKPKDIYQRLAMDSMKKNKLTAVRGPAGTGKSWLSLGFLFEKLEKGEIDRIIVFCNTVATAGSAKLGFYPGTRDEKLLDSQIGNLLSSKLGDRIMVEKMMQHGELVLLPMSDIRGYDTSGMKAGIYITEAQNMDIELMRLALQRIGEDSICILDGDSDAQVDLGIYSGSNNGMRRVSEVFRGDPCYGEVTLKNIHRSRIARIAQKM